MNRINGFFDYCLALFGKIPGVLIIGYAVDRILKIVLGDTDGCRY